MPPTLTRDRSVQQRRLCCSTAALALVATLVVGSSGCVVQVGGEDEAGDRSTSGATAAGYQPVNPFRALDTRGGERLSDGATRCFTVAGHGGVPASARAVALNLVAVSPMIGGYLTAFPAGTARPATSSLNVGPGQVVANGVLVDVGTGGKACVYARRATHLIVDVSGYFGAAAGYVPLRSYRRLDTRTQGILGDRGTRCLKVAGRDGVPATATAVALNLAAVVPAGSGYLVAYPRGIARPSTSTLNYSAGQTTANGAIVKVGHQGEICVYARRATHLIVDVSGYFKAGADYRPLATPRRGLDTRSAGSIVGTGATRCVEVAGRHGVPASARAVALNLAAVAPSGRGYLVAYPDGHGKPQTSTLNFSQGVARANNALVQPGAGGRICVYASRASHVLLDVLGYWPGAPNPCAGMVCSSPPKPTCTGGDTLVKYAAKGTCKAGTCIYPKTTERCSGACANAACCLPGAPGCAKTSLKAAKTPWPYPVGSFYRYAGSAVEENGYRYTYWCANLKSGVVRDHIIMRRDQWTGSGWSVGAEQVALAPGAPGRWDDQHVCDPDVVRGVFHYRAPGESAAKTYSYALVYLGAAYGGVNQVGWAVSNSLQGPWKRVSVKQPLVGASEWWGAGQPSVTSIDGKGDVLLFYTRGDSKGTRTMRRKASLLVANTPVLGAEKALPTKGLTRRDGSPDPVNHAGAVIYDSSRDRFWLIRSGHPFPGGCPNIISDHLQVASIPGASVWKASGTWTVHTNVTGALLGSARVFDGGFAKNAYGNPLATNRLDLIVSVSQACVGNNFGTALWSYRTHGVTMGL